MKTAVELFQQGDLAAALEIAITAVKAKPTDVAARSLLCELLCFSGDLERADKQLDAVLKTDPKALPGVSLMRHLIRSEITRNEVYEQGRVPDFLVNPTEAQQKRLQSLIAIREGRLSVAMQLINEASELEPDLKGSMDGKPFEGFCDLDDVLGPVIEVFTATGAYYWVDASQIVSLEFSPVEHLTDMLWRAASIETIGSLTGRVHLPAMYYGTARSADPKVKIGRTTDWDRPDEQSPVRGMGRREYLIGEDAVTIMDIKTLRFTQEG